MSWSRWYVHYLGVLLIPCLTKFQLKEQLNEQEDDDYDEDDDELLDDEDEDYGEAVSLQRLSLKFSC